MEELQSLMLLVAVFLTTMCAGFIVGVNFAMPVRRQLLEQIRADLLKHLEDMRRMEEKRNVGGFRLVTGGRDDRPAS
jgi:hypothetical protein